MSSFAAIAAGSCPRHEELALGLCAELGCAEGDARERLLELARDLRPAADPREELDAVRVLVESLRPSARGPLLLPDALGGGGHPVVVAVAAASAAAHAGLRVEPVGDGVGHLFLAHAALEPPLVVDPAAPEQLVDGRFLGHDLTWRCAHETALACSTTSSTARRGPATSPPHWRRRRCASPCRSTTRAARASPSSTPGCSPA